MHIVHDVLYIVYTKHAHTKLASDLYVTHLLVKGHTWAKCDP